MTTDRLAESDDTHDALREALLAVLQPLARLAVARGVPFAVVEELVKRAFVKAAADAHPGAPPRRSVSRISTATGIHRREVTRITQAAEAQPRRARSPASELFAHWLTDRRYRRADGKPRVLPRTGPAPSFESLAAEITRNVHPRSLLDELVRLRLATLDDARDTVTLCRDAFVPSGDAQRMLGFLGENVGDHLDAAVDNVLGGDRRHFEQAIFADGLSEQSMAWVREAITTEWRNLLRTLVPELEARIEADGRGPGNPDRRLRVGLYTFEANVAAAPAAKAAAAPRRRKRKKP